MSVISQKRTCNRCGETYSLTMFQDGKAFCEFCAYTDDWDDADEASAPDDEEEEDDYDEEDGDDTFNPAISESWPEYGG